MKSIQRLGLAIFLGALAGCVTPVKVVPLTGNIMVDGPRMITNGPPQDKVLWQYRTARRERKE